MDKNNNTFWDQHPCGNLSNDKYKNIEYRKFSNLEGPIYEQDKSDILMIKYENGEVERYNIRKVESKYKTNWKGWVFLGVVSHLIVFLILDSTMN